MSAADIVRIDQLGHQYIIGVKEALPLDHTGRNAYLLTRRVGIRACQRTQTYLGASLNTALVLVPSVQTDDIGIAKIINLTVPMGAEHGVHISRRGQNGLGGK